MQCTSYIPVYYNARDLNAGASGFPWHLFDSNTNFGEEGSYNNSLPQRDMNQLLGYDKAVLRQIMQNHEATFRYQVQELHRLYRRQRELMGEMRAREVLAQDLQSQTSESCNCLSHVRSDISQTTSHGTSWLLGYSSHSKLSELTAENIQRPPNVVATNFQEHTTLRPGPFIRKNSYNEVKFQSSRSKGDEKSLDLELPVEAPELTCSTPNERPHIQPASDSGDLSSYNSYSRKTTCFIDLNEPIQLESLPSSSTSPSETYICHVSVEAIPKSVDLDGNSEGIHSSVAFDLNCMPVNCISESEITPENLQTMRKGKCVEDDPVLLTKIADKFWKTETYIDLNSGVVVDEPSPLVSSSNLQIKSAGNTDLQGPVSPENEECSPPRGKSEDILLSERVEGELSMELDITAAQTLLMVSSAGNQEYTKAAIPEPLVNFGHCLHWFAEIVLYTGDDLENEVMKLQHVGADNDQGDLSHADFQETTLMLEENAPTDTGSGKSPARVLRKDLRTEGHPSNASLSKNLPIVEGYLETASLRRKTGKKACAKPRKYSKSHLKDVVKKSTSLTLKQPATRSKQGILQGWGAIQKRQGGHRRRASKFLIMS